MLLRWNPSLLLSFSVQYSCELSQNCIQFGLFFAGVKQNNAHLSTVSVCCVVARSRKCYLKFCEASLWYFHERFCSSTFPTYAPMLLNSEWFQEPSHVFIKEVSTLHLCGVLKPGALPTAWEHRSTGVSHRVTCTCCPSSISEEILFKVGCRAQQSEHILQN